MVAALTQKKPHMHRPVSVGLMLIWQHLKTDKECLQEPSYSEENLTHRTPTDYPTTSSDVNRKPMCWSSEFLCVHQSCSAAAHSSAENKHGVNKANRSVPLDLGGCDGEVRSTASAARLRRLMGMQRSGVSSNWLPANVYKVSLGLAGMVSNRRSSCLLTGF